MQHRRHIGRRHDDDERLTIAAIAEAGILQAIEEIERDYGGQYPAREQELRGGRPIK